MMPASAMALIVGAVAFSSLGQVLLKSGAQHLAPQLRRLHVAGMALIIVGIVLVMCAEPGRA